MVCLGSCPQIRQRLDSLLKHGSDNINVFVGVRSTLSVVSSSGHVCIELHNLRRTLDLHGTKPVLVSLVL
jgi:hypothetical protein